MRGGKKLIVEHGSVMIYYNFKLCENEVANFNKLIEGNVSRSYMLNSGNSKKCRNNEIKTKFQVLSHAEVEILWTDASTVNFSNTKDSPGYLIQYVAIDDFEKREVDENMLYERDICSSFGWRNTLVKQEDFKIKNHWFSFVLQNLTQYTSYAYTVQLYYYQTPESINNYTQRSGRGASEAQIFKTKMIRPSRVVKFSTAVKTIDSIELEFEVRSNENSAIDNFLIHVYEHAFDTALIDNRNFCDSPIEDYNTVIYTISDTINHYDDDREDCCDKCCEFNNERSKNREADDDNFRESLIKFTDETRKNSDKHFSKMQALKGFKEKIVVNATLRSYIVSKLKPFTLYTFHIYACTQEPSCSEYEIHSENTAHNEKYDRVVLRPLGVIISDQNNKFLMHFDEPKLKNGAIVSYVVELRQVNENSTELLHSECITRKHHAENKFR